MGSVEVFIGCDYPEFVKALPVCSETKFIADDKSCVIDEASIWVQKKRRRDSASQAADLPVPPFDAN